MSVRPRARICDDHQRVLQQVCRLARSPEDQGGDEGGRPGRRFQRSLAQGLGRSDFTGGPKVDIAVRTTGLLTAGRKPRSGVFCRNSTTITGGNADTRTWWRSGEKASLFLQPDRWRRGRQSPDAADMRDKMARTATTGTDPDRFRVPICRALTRPGDRFARPRPPVPACSRS